MNFNNKIFIFALATTITGSILAETKAYQASVTALNEPTLTNIAELHFGSITPMVGSSCTMDTTGTITGACDVSDTNILIGAVTLTDLTPSTDLKVNVTGSIGTHITFFPMWDIKAAGTGNADGIPDGTTSNITVDGLANTIILNVYGEISVDTTLTEGVDYTAAYVVNVVFQ